MVISLVFPSVRLLEISVGMKGHFLGNLNEFLFPQFLWFPFGNFFGHFFGTFLSNFPGNSSGKSLVNSFGYSFGYFRGNFSVIFFCKEIYLKITMVKSKQTHLEVYGNFSGCIFDFFFLQLLRTPFGNFFGGFLCNTFGNRISSVFF